jgi:hypothetical protein
MLSEDVVCAALPMRRVDLVAPGQSCRTTENSIVSKSTIRGSSRNSRKGTVFSGEASVFCYGHERERLRKQTVARLDGYPELALLVRAIKYLGIYRQKALLSALASRDRPRAGVLMGDVEKAVVD